MELSSADVRLVRIAYFSMEIAVVVPVPSAAQNPNSQSARSGLERIAESASSDVVASIRSNGARRMPLSGWPRAESAPHAQGLRDPHGIWPRNGDGVPGTNLALSDDMRAARRARRHANEQTRSDDPKVHDHLP
jgi:hypothetical protein